jgi:tetratricopeptide (TPR) repeat protein
MRKYNNAPKNIFESDVQFSCLSTSSEEAISDIENLTQLINQNPNEASNYYQRAVLYASIDNWNLALNDLTSVINSSVDDFFIKKSYYYLIRGGIYKELEKYDYAIKDYSIAIDLGELKGYIERGKVYAKQKNYKLAIDNYTTAIKSDLDSGDVYIARAYCYFKIKEYDLAINDCNRVINFLDDDNVYYGFEDIIAYAMRSYCLAKKLDPDNNLLSNDIDTWVNKAIALESAKEFHEKMVLEFKEAKQHEIAILLLEEVKKIDYKKTEEYSEYEKYAIELIESKNELKNIERKLQAKDKELEDMMSMFAHKFRSPLDAIIYNTTHDKDAKLYTESANTMRGLLDIFSIISADDKILTDKIKNDSKGNATLMSVLNKNLNMTLLHLLSVSGMSKIHQHYMNYAKAQGKITDAVSYKEWCNDYFEMEGALQKQWEQEFSALLNQSASLAERLQWLEHYFFKLDIIGFEIESIQFKEYETTESFLFILMNEILVNAFKYYASENKQPVVLEWTATENDQILSCRNPSIRRERDQHKGSGKGHTFLSALARKTGCKFTKPKPQDDFLLEFSIPNQLLLSNSGTEK